MVCHAAEPDALQEWRPPDEHRWEVTWHGAGDDGDHCLACHATPYARDLATISSVDTGAATFDLAVRAHLEQFQADAAPGDCRDCHLRGEALRAGRLLSARAFATTSTSRCWSRATRASIRSSWRSVGSVTPSRGVNRPHRGSGDLPRARNPFVHAVPPRRFGGADHLSRGRVGFRERTGANRLLTPGPRRGRGLLLDLPRIRWRLGPGRSAPEDHRTGPGLRQLSHGALRGTPPVPREHRGRRLRRLSRAARRTSGGQLDRCGVSRAGPRLRAPFRLPPLHRATPRSELSGVPRGSGARRRGSRSPGERRRLPALSREQQIPLALTGREEPRLAARAQEDRRPFRTSTGTRAARRRSPRLPGRDRRTRPRS